MLNLNSNMNILIAISFFAVAAVAGSPVICPHASIGYVSNIAFVVTLTPGCNNSCSSNAYTDILDTFKAHLQLMIGAHGDWPVVIQGELCDSPVHRQLSSGTRNVQWFGAGGELLTF